MTVFIGIYDVSSENGRLPVAEAGNCHNRITEMPTGYSIGTYKPKFTLCIFYFYCVNFSYIPVQEHVVKLGAAKWKMDANRCRRIHFSIEFNLIINVPTFNSQHSYSLFIWFKKHIILR